MTYQGLQSEGMSLRIYVKVGLETYEGTEKFKFTTVVDRHREGIAILVPQC